MFSELLNNPTFIGGAGAFLVGGVLWSLRSVLQAIPQFLTSLLTTKVELTSEYQHYRKIADFTGRHRISFAQRNYALRSDRFEYDNTHNYNPALGFGVTFGRYQGCWFLADLTLHTGSAQKPYETLKLVFLTRKIEKLYAFIGESLQGMPDALNVVVHIDDHDLVVLHKPKRAFDKIYLAPETKQTIISAFDKFNGSEPWYREHNIPYKLGVLFYGEPGCGKTSLIYALASHFSWDIVSLHSADSLYDTIQNYTTNTLLVIEDIDALVKGLNRENEEQTVDDKASNLHKLLNVFDGALTPHGFKFVITTNHIEKLDEALLRPGRLDLKLEIEKAPESEITRMYRDFYSVDFNGPAVAMRGCDAQALFVGKTADEAARALKTLAFDKTAAGM